MSPEEHPGAMAPDAAPVPPPQISYEQHMCLLVEPTRSAADALASCLADLKRDNWELVSQAMAYADDQVVLSLLVRRPKRYEAGATIGEAKE